MVSSVMVFRAGSRRSEFRNIYGRPSLSGLHNAAIFSVHPARLFPEIGYANQNLLKPRLYGCPLRFYCLHFRIHGSDADGLFSLL